MNQQIVNLRALAIIFIVLGHSIIIYDHTFDLLTSDVEMPQFESLKHWISFIQLKLFFSISGFLLCYKVMRWREKSNREIVGTFLPFLKDKVVRLLVPYLCVALLWMDPIKIVLGVPDYRLSAELLLQQFLFSNCGHLWYLPCLFLIFAVLFPVLSLIRNSRLLHIFLLFSLMGVNYLHGRFPEAIQLQNVAYYLFYFYFGYFINYTILIAKEIKITQFLHTRWLQSDICFTRVFVVSIFFLSLLGGLVIKSITSIGYELYLSVILLLLFYYFMPSFCNNMISEISNRSYGIYLFHSPLIYITALCCPNINPWLMLFLNFAVFGTIAYGLTIAFSRTRLKFIVGS